MSNCIHRAFVSSSKDLVELCVYWYFREANKFYYLKITSEGSAWSHLYLWDYKWVCLWVATVLWLHFKHAGLEELVERYIQDVLRNVFNGDHRLERLDERIVRTKAQLIILDSAASLLRKVDSRKYVLLLKVFLLGVLRNLNVYFLWLRLRNFMEVRDSAVTYFLERPCYLSNGRRCIAFQYVILILIFFTGSTWDTVYRLLVLFNSWYNIL